MKSVFDKAHRVFCDCMNDGDSVLASIQYLKLAYWEIDGEEHKLQVSEMISKLNKKYLEAE